MPPSISVLRFGAVIGAAAWLAGCSQPSGPQTQAAQPKPPASNPSGTAKVAPPGPITPPIAPTALALNTPDPNPDALEINVPAPGDLAVSPPEGAVKDGAVKESAVRQAQAEAPATAPAASEDQSPVVRAINQASGGKAPAGWKIKGANPSLMRLETLLDRAGFSPGVIDGKDGGNLKHAIAAYAGAHGLSSGGANSALIDSLARDDSAPAAQTYEISAQDTAGPFIGDPPKDYEALSKLPALSYSTPLQLLSEKFHMDPGLIKALNPGADFGRAGTRIVVAAPRMTPRVFTVARIEVDKTLGEVRAYDASDKLAAFYPATVGSTERPAPSGVFKVTAVAPRPAYFYDPKRLTFQPEGAKGKLKIAPGPNNPVGSTWIAITVPTYGIHGSPDPTTIGKRQSHGCVRLTNWDAVELGKAVKKGVKVDFIGTEKKA